MKESYDTIICVPYCDLQYLLKFENEFAYSARSEGWAGEIYTNPTERVARSFVGEEGIVLEITINDAILKKMMIEEKIYQNTCKDYVFYKRISTKLITKIIK